jgi:aryl-alcohol dehydrogenase-like predicted oxidoreductase
MPDHDGSTLTRREFVAAAALASVAPRLAHAADAPSAAPKADLTQRAIPVTGERIPIVGLGTNAYGVTSAEDIAARRAVVERLAALGGQVIDTAQAYGESEAVLGGIIESLDVRKRVFLATKTPIRGPHDDPERLLADALARLRTDRIDLMQVHNLAGVETLLPAFRRWKERGAIRYLGVSTSNAEQYPALLELMRREPLDFIQVDYSLANRAAAAEILPLAADRKMATLINLPFGGRRGGNLIRALGERPLPDFAVEVGATDWGGFLLRYVLGHPAVTCAIPGTTRVANLESNLAAARGALPDAAMRARMERWWDGADVKVGG